MNKVSVGVVGLGWFGDKHLQVLSQLPNVELAAVCSRSKTRALETARRYGVKTIYTDWNKIAADPRIDAITVTTHLPDHREPVVAAAEAGKQVYVEKPIAGTLSDADAMIRATRKSGVLFMVGHILRFENRYVQVKKIIDEGRLGKIVSIYARRNIPGAVARSHLRHASSFVLDAIHDTDLMLWYLRKRVKTVFATLSKVGKVDNPDVGWGIYGFEGGAKGVCETVWVLRGDTPFSIDARMEVLGTKGAAYVDCTESGLLVNEEKGTKRPDTIHWPEMHGQIVGALRDEVAYWIDCVQKNRKPKVVRPEEAREALKVVLAAVESSRRNRLVSL
jgi:UDP-N-acetylglucosamine 3-dehydrogenase